jgi:hypothetical protein
MSVLAELERQAGDGSSPAKRYTVNSRRCNLRTWTPRAGRPWRGRTLATVNPSADGLIGYRRLLSVGSTYGYSWTGPLRGHIPLAHF